MIAKTPQPPYYAVIFTSIRDGDPEYEKTAERMVVLAEQQPGFLGFESARENIGISVSYWSDLDAIAAWKNHAEHQLAQKMGREMWYQNFKIRIAKVERD